jgi:hypothetical protein
MNDQTITTDQTTVIPADRNIVVSTLGYMCIAITWWMLGMLMTGWFSPPTLPAITTGTVYSVGSILLVIVGILALIYGRHTLDAIVFLGMSGLLFSLHLAHLAGLAGESTMVGYYGWYALLWAIFFGYLWLASLQPGSGTFRMLFLLLFWLGALAAALGGWTTSTSLEVLSGYLLLISAVIAFIVSAREVLSHHPQKLFSREKITVTSTQQPPHPAM